MLTREIITATADLLDSQPGRFSFIAMRIPVLTESDPGVPERYQGCVIGLLLAVAGLGTPGERWLPLVQEDESLLGIEEGEFYSELDVLEKKYLHDHPEDSGRWLDDAHMTAKVLRLFAERYPPAPVADVMVREPIGMDHVGDGVYASFNGYSIEVRVNDHRNPVAVTLDPQVLQGLVNYARRAGMVIK